MAIFTNPVGANWQSVSFLNEIIDAYNERRIAVGDAAVPTLSAGDNIQKASLWLGIQEWISLSINSREPWAWIDADTVSATNPGSFYTGSSISTKIGLTGGIFSSAGFRRSTDGIATSIGVMATGDIIGPWIFEDIQKYFNVMTHTASSSPVFPPATSGESGSRSGTGQEIGLIDNDQSVAAHDKAVADYNSKSWSAIGPGGNYSVYAKSSHVQDLFWVADVVRSRHKYVANIPNSDVPRESFAYDKFAAIDWNIDGISPAPVLGWNRMMSFAESVNGAVSVDWAFDDYPAPTYPGSLTTQNTETDASRIVVKWDFTHTL